MPYGLLAAMLIAYNNIAIYGNVCLGLGLA